MFTQAAMARDQGGIISSWSVKAEVALVGVEITDVASHGEKTRYAHNDLYRNFPDEQYEKLRKNRYAFGLGAGAAWLPSSGASPRLRRTIPASRTSGSGTTT